MSLSLFLPSEVILSFSFPPPIHIQMTLLLFNQLTVPFFFFISLSLSLLLHIFQSTLFTLLSHTPNLICVKLTLFCTIYSKYHRFNECILLFFHSNWQIAWRTSALQVFLSLALTHCFFVTSRSNDAR